MKIEQVEEDKLKKLKREHKEAHKKLLQTKWKTETCSQGAKCWCRVVVPVKEIRYSEDEQMMVSRSGELSKETAEYIVKLHNDKLDNDQSNKVV